MHAFIQDLFRPYFSAMPLSRLVKGFICIGLGLGTANCAGNNQRQAARKSSEVGAFSHPKYGKASERVIADGETVPKGGGRYQIGKPYSVAGRSYVPQEMNGKYTSTGMASWYGEAFHGRKTANGEVYDKDSVTAAHPTMPLPSYARVTNANNGRSIIVRVNDRGPYHGGRLMDVSQRVAEALEFKHIGTARIKVDHLGPAGLAGSDDRKLLASLTTGQPAQLQSTVQQVQIASNDPTFAPAFVSTAPVYKAPLPKVSTPSTIPQPVIEQADMDGESDAAQAPVLVANTASAVTTEAASPEITSPAPVQMASETTIPLPPQRPYNLGAISAPVKIQNIKPASILPQQQAILPRAAGSGTKMASFYAQQDDLRTNITKNDPFEKLKTENKLIKSGSYIDVGIFKTEANAHRIIAALGTGSKTKLTIFKSSYKVTAGPFANTFEASNLHNRAKALGASDAKIVVR